MKNVQLHEGKKSESQIKVKVKIWCYTGHVCTYIQSHLLSREPSCHINLKIKFIKKTKKLIKINKKINRKINKKMKLTNEIYSEVPLLNIAENNRKN